MNFKKGHVNIARALVLLLLILLIHPSDAIFGLGGILSTWIAEHLFEIKYDPNKYEQNEQILEEALLDTTDIIVNFGYLCETHHAQTEDGFILTLHRIPFGEIGHRKSLPVLLLHGFSSTSAQWVNNRHDSLGFILADEGYDVWMGNFRGNHYTEHVKFPRSSQEFWDFSIDEHAYYDLPAMIEYILYLTGSPQLLFIGYSMATTVGFALLSAHGNFNDKIAGFVALAPIASVTYTTTILFKPEIRNFKFMQLGYQLDKQPFYHVISPLNLKVRLHSCPSSDPVICEFSFALIGGYDPYVRNRTRMPIYTAHLTSGTSVRNAAHFSQMWKKKKFTRYDYGKIGNIIRHKQPIPAEYDVTKITAPIALYYAANDAIANPLDVELLSRKIRKLASMELLPHPMAMHTDLVWLEYSRDFLYRSMVRVLNKMYFAAIGN